MFFGFLFLSVSTWKLLSPWGVVCEAAIIQICPLHWQIWNWPCLKQLFFGITMFLWRGNRKWTIRASLRKELIVDTNASHTQVHSPLVGVLFLGGLSLQTFYVPTGKVGHAHSYLVCMEPKLFPRSASPCIVYWMLKLEMTLNTQIKRNWTNPATCASRQGTRTIAVLMDP